MIGAVAPAATAPARFNARGRREDASALLLDALEEELGAEPSLCPEPPPASAATNAPDPEEHGLAAFATGLLAAQLPVLSQLAAYLPARPELQADASALQARIKDVQV
jgi:hypothetical protein